MSLGRKRAALAAFSTLFTLLLAELAVRVLGLAPTHWVHHVHLESDDKRVGVDLYPDNTRGYFRQMIDDDEVIAHLAAANVNLDRHARTPHAVPLRYTESLCRGSDPGPKQGRRIVIVGDSFAEGQGVYEEDTFAARLDDALTNAEVLNCGRRGYDFPDLRGFFERQLALDPDVVVYAMTLNDPQQSEAFHSQQEFLNDWIMDRRHMVDDAPANPPWWKSRLWALASDRLEGRRVADATTRWYRDMVDTPNAAGWAATQDHVAAMAAEVEARGGTLHVVLLPLFVDLHDYPFRSVHETIRNAFEARGVTVHDLLATFEGEDARELWVHPADRHPNERAHAMIADALEPVLR
ncbi:MAG: SGNH/GDSL hydrolase family protein [Myxococcota bacterium]